VGTAGRAGLNPHAPCVGKRLDSLGHSPYFRPKLWHSFQSSANSFPHRDLPHNEYL